MDLSEYNRRHKTAGIRALALAADMAPARLYEIIRRGGHALTLKTARKIADASNGAISVEELLGLPPRTGENGTTRKGKRKNGASVQRVPGVQR